MNLKCRQIRFLSLFIIFFCLLFETFSSVVYASDDFERQYRILFISSYGFSNAVVPDELSGFEAGLEELNYQIDYEFMDTEYYYRAEDIDNFRDYLSYKISAGGNFDLIALADDQALRFLNNHRQTLLKNKPVVFFGVNNTTEAMTTSDLPGVTGIAEVIDIERNYKLMQELFPDRKTLVAIVDATISGQGDFVEFMKFKDAHPDLKTRIINTSYYTANGIKDVLNELGEDDIILFLDFSIDGESNLYPLQTAASFISKNTTNVPIFRVGSANIEHGVLGGLSYSYYDAGLMAGSMARKILLGEDPDSMPLVTSSISTPFFEQGQMDIFNLKSKDLPIGSVVLNERQTLTTFYRDNKTVSNLVMLTALLLIIVIGLLLGSNRRRYKLIRTDYLTQLPNRTFITERIAKAVESKKSYGIIMMDVDHFKGINDTKGHQVGDEILAGVAKRLKEFSGRNITFARLGGDEFSAIISKPDKEKVIRICEKIVTRMQDDFETSIGTIKITVSLGCALYPEDVDDINEVMEYADKALYVTKEHGRNGFHLFSQNDISV